MNRNSTQNKVSICKKDVCLNVYGDLAKGVAATLSIALLAYAVTQVVKAIKYPNQQFRKVRNCLK